MKPALTPTGLKIINVHCGLVTGAGKRTEGCGVRPERYDEFTEFRYMVPGYSGLWSTLVLCPDCESKASKRIRRAS